MKKNVKKKIAAFQRVVICRVDQKKVKGGSIGIQEHIIC